MIRNYRDSFTFDSGNLIDRIHGWLKNKTKMDVKINIKKWNYEGAFAT